MYCSALYLLSCITYYGIFQITNGAMSSSLVISASDANATLHNDMYACQVTLTVDCVDNFTTTSNIAIVGLRGTV